MNHNHHAGDEYSTDADYLKLQFVQHWQYVYQY